MSGTTILDSRTCQDQNSQVNSSSNRAAASKNIALVKQRSEKIKFSKHMVICNSSNANENQDLNFCTNGKFDPPEARRTIDEGELMKCLQDYAELISSTPCNADAQQLNKIQINNVDEDQPIRYSFPRMFIADKTDENVSDPFVLQPSLFHANNVPPTIYFNTKMSDDSKPPVGLPKSLQSLFKWKISSITPNSIRNCVAFMKFETIRPSNNNDTAFLGSWCKHMPTADFSHLDEWRKVNHYPGSFHMGRKDKLWLRLRLANQKYHKFDSFHPTTFVLPRDYEELDKYWKSSPSNLFIIKPPASARGNGIKVINNIAQIPENALKLPKTAEGMPMKKSTMIVQQYISNSCLLENGLKFDLRVYVLVTSVDPLRIYVCEEGLVRFASAKYTSQEDGIIDQYMHLTNYFVNKNNQEYQINNDCESLNGCKWTLKRFWRYLEEHYSNINAQKLWNQIKDIIIKTIICCEGPMTRLSHLNCKNDYSSYELFGFDIILDSNFKPWILEVNITPSLKSESNLDTSVKYEVIKDMFNIVGYNLPPPTAEDKTRLGDLANCRLFFDRRLYTENLTKKDKMKHLKYQKLFKSEQGTLKPSTQLDDVNNETGGQHNHLNLVSDASAHSSQALRGLDDPKNLLDITKHDGENNHLCAKGGNELLSDEESTAFTSKPFSVDGILDDLTQSDIRVLMLAEDELSRCGLFKRVFPSTNSGDYLKYFDRPRHYNLLLFAWEQKYANDRAAGIKRLSGLANFLE